jgi:hypothetical protein
LLLRVEVSELTLPLGRHPSLRLQDLLRLVGASRRLVTLRSIEIMEICSLRATTAVVEVVDRVSTRATHSTIYNQGGTATWLAIRFL